MHCPTCQTPVSFARVLKIINPFRYQCACCGATLTLGQQGMRYLSASAAGGGLLAGAFISVEQAGILPPACALAMFTLAFILGGLAGEWYIWKHGVLKKGTWHPRKK